MEEPLNMALGANFRVADYAKKLSDVVSRDARAEHDLLINAGKKKETPSNHLTSGGAGHGRAYVLNLSDSVWITFA